MKEMLMNEMSNKDFAIAYARQGISVLPIHYIVDGKCSCGRGECTSPGKHPMTPSGVKDATSDINIIEEWWNRWPQANVAMASGSRSGIVVLDVDSRHDGLNSLQKMYEHHGKISTEAQVTTGGGGMHFYFRNP